MRRKAPGRACACGGRLCAAAEGAHRALGRKRHGVAAATDKGNCRKYCLSRQVFAEPLIPAQIPPREAPEIYIMWLGISASANTGANTDRTIGLDSVFAWYLWTSKYCRKYLHQ